MNTRNRCKMPVVLGLVIAASLLVTPSLAGAATRYVATTGSDGNPGTLASPWQTLSYAVSRLVAGDILYIRGGTYTGTANLIDSQVSAIGGGTSWANPITIAGYPGEVVTLQPPDGAGAIALRTPTQQYSIFQDLVIDGSLGSNYWVSELVYVSGGAHHNRFLRLEVKNGYVNGYQLSDNGGNSPFNQIIGGSIHHNGRSTGIGDGYGYGIYNHSSDTLIEGVDVYANAGYGIHSYTSGGNINNSRLTVRKCTIHGNGTNPNGSRGGTLYGLLIASGDSNIAYDNLIYGNRGGVQIYSASTNTKLYNNTIYGNTLAGIVTQYSSTATIMNNIVYLNGSGIVDNAGDSTLSHNLTANPMFVNVSASDFHLQSASPAIDAGLAIAEVPDDFSGILRPAAAPYDIGAYQRPTASAPPSEPKNVRLSP